MYVSCKLAFATVLMEIVILSVRKSKLKKKIFIANLFIILLPIEM